MPEDNAATQKAPKPQVGAAKPDDGAANSQDGSIMNSALFNLMIAEQYIDATSRLPEHRLVCFHYAVALLAASRNDPTQRTRARDYFRIALCWQANTGQEADIPESIDRIVCESHYNLGVIDELEEHYTDAQKSYRSAIEIAKKYRDEGDSAAAGKFDNVALLAGLGSISSATTDIQIRWKKIKNRKGVSSDAKGTDELRPMIQRTKNDVDELKKRIKALEEIVRNPSQSSKPTSPPPPKKGAFLLQFLRILPQEVPEANSVAEPKAVVLRGEILDKINDKLDVFNGDLEAIEVEMDSPEEDQGALESAPESAEGELEFNQSQLESIERLRKNIESDLRLIELEMDRFKEAPDAVKSAQVSTESRREAIERLRKNIENELASFELDLILESNPEGWLSRRRSTTRRIRRATSPTADEAGAEPAAPEGETETES